MADPITDKVPPRIGILAAGAVDTCCFLAGGLCSNWRDHLTPSWSDWFGWSIPSPYPALPPLLSYKQFCGDNDCWSVKSLYQYASLPSTNLADHSTVDAMVVLFFLVLFIRSIKRQVIPYFSQIGRKMGRKIHGEAWEKNNQVRIVKFGEYCFRTIFHSLISFYAVASFLNRKEWMEYTGFFHFTNTNLFFQNWPFHPIETELIWYYLVQGAYNMDAMISLLELSFTVKLQPPIYRDTTNEEKFFIQSPITIGWSPTARGDFAEMFVHHVVTNVLVHHSSSLRFHRIGVMVFMVHDISDIPVDLCKLANFLKWGQATAVTFFAMCLTWLVTRLYILPFTVMNSTIHEAHLLHPSAPNVNIITYLLAHTLFVIFLGLLVSLHLVWFIIFIRILKVQLSSREWHDLSEHKKGEKQVHHVASAKKGQ